MESDINAKIDAPVSQEVDPRLDNNIGTIEQEKLTAVKIVVVRTEIENKSNKAGKVVGDIVNLFCKHPDKVELIKLSQGKIEVEDGKLKEAGLWYNEDADGNLQKGSILGIVLAHYGCANLKALEKQEIETTKNSGGYLAVKAY